MKDKVDDLTYEGLLTLNRQNKRYHRVRGSYRVPRITYQLFIFLITSLINSLTCVLNDVSVCIFYRLYPDFESKKTEVSKVFQMYVSLIIYNLWIVNGSEDFLGLRLSTVPWDDSFSN